MTDPEVLKLSRGMNHDEREAFITIYADLKAKALQAAKKKAREIVQKRRQEQAKAAPARIKAINAELEKIVQDLARLKEQNTGILPDTVDILRSQRDNLIKERAQCEAVINGIQ